MNSAKRDANGFFKVLLLSSHLLICRHPVQKSNFCPTYNVTLIPQWLPRELINACADAISHIVDFDDWYTTPEFFADMDRLWGQHTVDRFANAANAHLPKFNSRFLVPGTEAVDAISISWNGENN